MPLEAIAAVVVVLGLIAGVGALLAARRLQGASGLPRARVVYTDTIGREQAGETLFSPQYRVAGKPDYLIASADGLIPVEVKPGRHAPTPYDGDVLQLLAYCLLVEETSGRPPYGLLRYATQTFRIDYTEGARTTLLDAVETIRAARLAGELHRSHDDPARCAACMFGEDCAESLAGRA